MKKIIALVLCFAMLLICTAAAAEETQSMGVLKVNNAFDITYNPLPDDSERYDYPCEHSVHPDSTAPDGTGDCLH